MHWLQRLVWLTQARVLLLTSTYSYSTYLYWISITNNHKKIYVSRCMHQTHLQPTRLVWCTQAWVLLLTSTYRYSMHLETYISSVLSMQNTKATLILTRAAVPLCIFTVAGSVHFLKWHGTLWLHVYWDLLKSALALEISSWFLTSLGLGDCCFGEVRFIDPACILRWFSIVNRTMWVLWGDLRETD